ncbi:MAG: putative sulfate exporter family transporter [Pseudomonadota bacterium]
MPSPTPIATFVQKERLSALPSTPWMLGLWRGKWGLLLAAIVALAAFGVASASGGPVMIFALFGGLAMARVSTQTAFRPGINIGAKQVLHLGVILLGAQIALADILALGWQPLLIAILAVAVMLSGGWAIGRACGLPSQHALISAGAVAICGSAAAMAICAALPKSEHRHTATVTTIMLVAITSSAAMAVYPIAATQFGLTDTQAGTFLGASIHNVAQAIGAGHIVSQDAAQTATVVKLMRVACLVPAIVLIAFLFARGASDDDGAPAKPAIPLFLIGFVGLVVINSLGLIPSSLADTMGSVSQFALVMSIVALGAQTTAGDLFRTSGAAVSAMVLQTVALAGFVLLAVSLL